MTISTTLSTATYVANGSTTVWPFAFPILADSDVQVIVTDVDGGEETLAPSAYTITGTGSTGGGSVIYPKNGAALTSGNKLTIRRNTAITQPVDLGPGAFYAEVHEGAFDRLTLVAQELQEQLDRAVLVPVGSGLDPAAYLSLAQAASAMSTAAQAAAEAAASTAADYSAAALDVLQTLDGRYPLLSDAITTNATLFVPSQFSSIQSALDSLATRVIARGATVTIKVDDGTYLISSGINANHPQGDKLRIVGNEATPANCVLQVAGMASFDAISTSAGHTLGWLNGFRIRSTLKADLAHNATGILAIQNSIIICGPNIEVDNFYYGIAARDASYIYCPNAVVTNAGDVGIWAFCGSTIVANGAISNNASDVANGYGFGFQAEFGSTLVAENASASGNYKAGIAALSNSTCRTPNATCSSNIGSGFLSWSGGEIECKGSTTNNNSRYGVEVFGYGLVNGIAKNTENALGAYNTFAFCGELGGQGRLATSSGALRIDSYTCTYFNTAGGLQLEIRNTQSAANRLTVTGSPLGDAPSVGVYGSEADIDLKLSPKGSGVVRFGVFSATSDTACNGYITIKDSAGTVRKLMTMA
ncbi:right-handed parallel beta-helix repeat-containing protein [Magnetospirillum molischianum]|uniref:Right handed beta helix domain-containing protein n=1 Tax=Magnetospirillum molischianum DSM 120 TaxID=1150626 RepID=H8FP79_MAGML|nr:right-handed parallel beta-helix repeat-containing protein [Magnetospirillum molischianum]CCG40167.1 hypothetical protein PHAMO_180136 [Magnetospirillum molischianum DSM 120]